MSVPVEPVSPQPGVVDSAIDAYVCWREESTDAREAYRRWSGAGKADRQLASCAYVAALDREEIAASVYARAVRRLGDACVDASHSEPQCVCEGFSSQARERDE